MTNSHRRGNKQQTSLTWVMGVIFFVSGGCAYLANRYVGDKRLFQLLIVIAGISFFIAVVAICAKALSKSRNRRQYYKKGLAQIDNMTGIEFENFLKAHFESLGYKADETATSGDFGVDLVLHKGGKTIAVQAKKRKKQNIGVSAVQEVVAGKAYYKTDRAMVVTNQRFTQAAKELAAANGVELWDRLEMQRRFPKLRDVEKYKNK